ncbi:DNA repair protein RadC [Ahrensia sp. R2A130]|uniref:RadC family protein n=1 Tax=Ahrensia sp. R2A130 TaxID=744979 RepID=UPI0001E0B471|nr:DNA repair protein RadC [Ahrensia sp. R2A130]EFL90158.1 putative DNA repair protein RadC-like protein [Ahrensia sp. R2A130]
MAGRDDETGAYDAGSPPPIELEESPQLPILKTAAAKPENLLLGHRDRARNRFEKRPDALEDYEVLEILLFQSVARADTKAIAKRLLKKFGSVRGVLGASSAELQKVEKVGPRMAENLAVVGEITSRALKDRIEGPVDLGSWSKVIAYCQSRMSELKNERLRVLYLNKQNGLMDDEEMQEGTVDHTPAYPREIVRRALEVGATAVILVHNHPSGDPTPSRADIELTRQINTSCQTMNIAVHDHIIIGRDTHTSMKALQLF